MNNFIKHLVIVVHDVQEKGLFLALANAAWFVRIFIPQRIFLSLIQAKHILVKKKINKVINNVAILSIPTTRKMCDFDQAPIWFCWLQGKNNMPLIVQLCLKSIKANSNGHPVVFVHLGNIEEYIVLPKHIIDLFEAGKIQYAHYADIIRTSLLYNYGGCWIDSTVFLTHQLSEKIFESDFFSVKLPVDKFFVSQARWSNFFLACKPGDKLMGKTLKMFEVYLSRKDYFVDYFMMDYFMDMIIELDADLKAQIDAIPYNNRNIHQLKFHLADQYSAEHFSDICGDTYIHKLSWKMHLQGTVYNSIANYLFHLYK